MWCDKEDFIQSSEHLGYTGNAALHLEFAQQCCNPTSRFAKEMLFKGLDREGLGFAAFKVLLLIQDGIHLFDSFESDRGDLFLYGLLDYDHLPYLDL